MKKSIFYLLVFTTSLIISNNIKAQDCELYFPHEKGTIVETTSYDKKNNQSSVLKQTVLENTESAGVTTIRVKNEIVSDESENVNSSEFTIKCQNGEFYINMDSYLNQEQMSAYQGMQVDVDADALTIPANLQAGQMLNNGKVTASVKNSGIKIFSITVDITNRKVDGFEKITTTAGTFDCVKISYDAESKIGFIKVKSSSKQWFSKGVGAVKTENYDKKGNLESSSLITKITK
ncbi:MAG: hypothetical protein JXR51_06810 [Bacteroidales bacterium]|nr:hypothetical protein [Bacteroidales bacterium]MBN2756874.1 hypothetical protein [Bacteroidales bacterium]